MPVQNARDIYNMSKEAVWSLPDGPMKLQFDDGVLETTARATIFSYYLGVFHRHYPKTPLLMRHHLGNELFTKDSHLDILGKAFWDCLDAHGDDSDIEHLCLLTYQTTNEIYNDFTDKLKAYISTISIYDFIDALEHPEIKKANKEVKPTQLSIDQTYQTITRVLKSPSELRGNTVAKMAKSGLVSIGQIQQCIGPRGFLTDINSQIFIKPILNGYVKGIMNLDDSMIESRSAAKALVFADDAIADSEYFNREMQLIASNVVRLHVGDCGSKEYLPFKVHSSDLKKIAGKYYLAEDGTEKEVLVDDRHLVGKLIRVRSVLKCKHPDAYGVCQKCFGSLGYAVPRLTNLGHACVTILCEAVSQNILSTKHLDGTSKVDEFNVLTDYDKQFIRVGSDPNTLKLSENLAGKEVYITIPVSEAQNLSTIEQQDTTKVHLNQISSISEVVVTIGKGEKLISAKVPVSMGSRFSSLTHEALAYIKKFGWKLTDGGNYIIDLSKWDNELPLFKLPLIHTDTVQYMRSIKAFVMASTKSKRTAKALAAFPTTEHALLEFYKLISSKLNVNIAHLETILLASMARDPENNDHRLPRPIKEGQLVPYGLNMEKRSYGVFMAYQGQAKKLSDIDSFMITTRPDHPMDNILCPFPQVNPQQ